MCFFGADWAQFVGDYLRALRVLMLKRCSIRSLHMVWHVESIKQKGDAQVKKTHAIDTARAMKIGH